MYVIVRPFFSNFSKYFKLRQLLGRALRLGQARGPSTGARTGQVGRVLRPHHQLYPCGTYEIHVQKYNFLYIKFSDPLYLLTKVSITYLYSNIIWWLFSWKKTNLQNLRKRLNPNHLRSYNPEPRVVALTPFYH